MVLTMNESIIVEQHLLSTILNYKHVMELVSRTVQVGHFQDIRHRLIYTACANLHIEGIGIDFVTVGNELNGLDALQNAGGNQYLADLLRIVTTSAQAEQYAQTVVDNHVKRCVSSIANDLSGCKTGHEALAEVEQRIQRIKQGLPVETDEQPLFTDEAFAECVTGLQEKSDRHLFTSGVAPLDRFIGGFERGTVSAIQALYKTGKTKFAMQILVRTARREVPVGFLSLEMTKKRVMRWLLSHVCRIDSNFFRRPHYYEWDEVREEHLQKIKTRGRELCRLPIYVNDVRKPTIDQVESIISAWANNGVQLVILDYFERMQLGQEWKEEGQVTSKLADMASKYDIALIYLDQLNKTADQPGAQTGLGHSRGSVSRAADADLILQMRNNLRDGSDDRFQTQPHKARIDMLIIAREGVSGLRLKDEIEADLSTGHFYGLEDDNQ